MAAEAETHPSVSPCSRFSTRCQPRSSLRAAASPGPALMPARGADPNSLERAVNRLIKGKSSTKLPQKEGWLWVYSCLTLCFWLAALLERVPYTTGEKAAAQGKYLQIFSAQP